MLFLFLSYNLDKRNIYTFFPQLLYIILKPLEALQFITISLFISTLLSIIKNKNNISSFLIIYFISILRLYMKSQIISFIFIIFLICLGFLFIKKQELSIWIIPQIVLSFILIKLIDNPYILGILFSIYKINSSYEQEIGINIFLLLFLIFYSKYSINQLIINNDLLFNKWNLYLLLIIFGISILNQRIIKKNN